MPGPQDLIAQLMMAQQAGGGGAPGSPGMPMPPGGGAMPPPMPSEPPPGSPPTDEAMLDNVSSQMGGGTPPPIGGMKWVSLEEDQQALLSDPSPENVQAFVQYWGEDKLPDELQGDAAKAGPEDVPDTGD